MGSTAARAMLRTSLLALACLVALQSVPLVECRVYDVGDSEIAREPELGETVGHHETADMACACCHKFKPSASCFSVTCNDGSGKFCWSPDTCEGGSQCTEAQKSGTCDVK